jgi:hypothetical protein
MTAALAPADAPPIRAVFSCARLGGDASRKNRLSGFGEISSVTFRKWKANHGGPEAADCFVARGVTIGAGAIMGTQSTVISNVQPGTIVAGSPIKEIAKGFASGKPCPRTTGWHQSCS